MDYELAKQLKAAGWPEQMVATCYVKGHHCFADQPDCKLAMMGAPTLSELIMACNDGFTELKRMIGNPFAYGKPNDETIWWSCPLEDLVNEGATPEESVARLWLALNKK